MYRSEIAEANIGFTAALFLCLYAVLLFLLQCASVTDTVFVRRGPTRARSVPTGPQVKDQETWLD